jgi:hypothetical protein
MPDISIEHPTPCGALGAAPKEETGFPPARNCDSERVSARTATRRCVRVDSIHHSRRQRRRTHRYEQNVYDPSDDKIGEIMRVPIDRGSKAATLTIGLGSFLGARERDAAVPFECVRVTAKDNNKYDLVMNSTKDALRGGRGFKYDRNAIDLDARGSSYDDHGSASAEPIRPADLCHLNAQACLSIDQFPRCAPPWHAQAHAMPRQVLWHG